MGEWISCKDQLPEDCCNVLIWELGFYPTGAWLSYDERGSPIFWTVEDWDGTGTRIRLQDVTHWMYVPQPPKEENCLH